MPEIGSGDPSDPLFQQALGFTPKAKPKASPKKAKPKGKRK
jgi:hypothetical protein